MATLHISDELARKLQELAARENRPVEEIAQQILGLFAEESASEQQDMAEAVRQMRQKIYLFNDILLRMFPEMRLKCGRAHRHCGLKIQH